MTPATRRAFERTVLPHTEAMLRKALALTKNPAEAEDLVQDALVRAMRFWDSYDPSQPPRAWLNTIVRNTFVNRYHALNRRRDVHTAVKAEAEVCGHEHVPPADEAVAAADEAVRVRAAVDSLPEPFAEVIRLVDLEGYGYYAAADRLGVPKGTVMSRLHRGRRKLRAALEAA